MIISVKDFWKCNFYFIIIELGMLEILKVSWYSFHKYSNKHLTLGVKHLLEKTCTIQIHRIPDFTHLYFVRKKLSSITVFLLTYFRKELINRIIKLININLIICRSSFLIFQGCLVDLARGRLFQRFVANISLWCVVIKAENWSHYFSVFYKHPVCCV